MRTILIAATFSGFIFLFIFGFFCYLFKKKLERKKQRKRRARRNKRSAKLASSSKKVSSCALQTQSRNRTGAPPINHKVSHYNSNSATYKKKCSYTSSENDSSDSQKNYMLRKPFRSPRPISLAYQNCNGSSYTVCSSVNKTKKNSSDNPIIIIRPDSETILAKENQM